MGECRYDWIPELELSKFDREALLNPIGWLTDSIIDAAQRLLKEISPVPGLESVACGLTMSFSIQRGDFVQILNTGKGHWVTAASIGAPPCVVRVYDSLYSSAGTALESQVATLIHAEQPSFSLEFMDVPGKQVDQSLNLIILSFIIIILQSIIIIDKSL